MGVVQITITQIPQDHFEQVKLKYLKEYYGIATDANMYRKALNALYIQTIQEGKP